MLSQRSPKGGDAPLLEAEACDRQALGDTLTDISEVCCIRGSLNCEGDVPDRCSGAADGLAPTAISLVATSESRAATKGRCFDPQPSVRRASCRSGPFAPPTSPTSTWCVQIALHWISTDSRRAESVTALNTVDVAALALL